MNLLVDQDTNEDLSGYKPMRLIIPAFFLVVLGLGNISVGAFKYAQYEEILREITLPYSTSATEGTQNQSQNINSLSLLSNTRYLSPLQKLKYTLDTPASVVNLKKKAEARRDFYSLVSYGGEVFLVLSLVLFVATGLSKYFIHE